MTKKVKRIIIKSIFNTLILGSIVFLTASFGPFIQFEIIYKLFNLTGKSYKLDVAHGSSNITLIQAIFSDKNTILIKPQNPNFDIIIPKIGLNEQIVDNVNSSDPNAVVDALKVGVGRARGTAYPNEFGNIYLFAHSSTNALSIDRYNAVFTLLRDLKNGDLIYIFYKGRQYTYTVYTKKTVSPNDTSDITFNSSFPQITLQTCDPPGFNINRLLIQARRVENH